MSKPQDDDDAQVLRITVARSGGVAGIAPSWTVTASAEPDVDSWLTLVESCPWDAPKADGSSGVDGTLGADGSPGAGETSGGDGTPGADGSPGAGESPGARGTAGGDGAPGGADRFVYTIRVILNPPAETAVATERDATVPETALDGPWRDLVDRVKQESKAARRKAPAGRKPAEGASAGAAAGPAVS